MRLKYPTRRRQRFSHALALTLLSLLAISLRAGNLPALRGTYALDNDSYRFLRIAEAEVAGRPIGAADPFRWRPEGRDMSTHLSLHPRVLARLYEAASGSGLHLSFRPFALRYSVLCYLLCLWVVYLWSARAFTPLAGLVAAAGMAAAPATVARSAAGFIDRDSVSLLLALGAMAAYSAALGGRVPAVRLAAAATCALLSALLGLTWEGAGLVTVLFAATFAWLALSGQLSHGVVALHLLWCGIALPPLLLATHAYRDLSQPHVALALVPVPFAALSALLAAAAGSLLGWGRGKKQRRAAPALLFAGAAGILFLAGVALLRFIVPSAPAAAAAFLQSAISTLGDSRLMLSVAELQDMRLADWWTRFGTSLVLFLLGVEVVANDLAGGGRRGQRLGLATLLAAAMVIGSNSLAGALGELWPSLPAEQVAGGVRLAALVLWFGLAVRLAPVTEARERPLAAAPRFLLLAWWFLLLVATAGAERYGFFLAAAGWAAAGHGLARLCGDPAGAAADACSRQVRGVLFLAAVLLLCLLTAGVAPLRFFLGSTAGVAVGTALLLLVGAYLSRVALAGGGKGTSPAGSRFARPAGLGALALILLLSTVRSRASIAALAPGFAWLSPALEQLDRRLPRDAVILAWWDYGSHLNVLARRATVIDEDHFRPARIEEVAREVYSASDPDRARRCMGRLGVTHWMLTDLDIDQLAVQTWIGAGPEAEPTLRTYRFQRGGQQARSEVTMLALPHPGYLDDLEALEALRATGRQIQVHALRLRHAPEAAGLPVDVELELAVGGRRIAVRPAIVVFRGRSFPASGPALPGVVLVREDGAGRIDEAVYFPPRASRTLPVRLFCLGERFPMLREVAVFNTPAGLFAPRGHRVMVWQVVY